MPPPPSTTHERVSDTLKQSEFQSFLEEFNLQPPSFNLPRSPFHDQNTAPPTPSLSNNWGFAISTFNDEGLHLIARAPTSNTDDPLHSTSKKLEQVNNQVASLEQDLSVATQVQLKSVKD